MGIGPDTGAVAALCRLCPVVYVDPPPAGVPLPRRAIPVHGLGDAPDALRSRLLGGDEQVAVRLPLARFADVTRLARDLARFCEHAAAPPRAIVVFVDVPCGDQPAPVVVAAAVGAVRRLPAPRRWARIVVGLDGDPGDVAVPGSLHRPPIQLLARAPELAHVGIAERAVTPDGAAVYPSRSSWFLSGTTAREAGALAELVAGHREFAGDSCCPGDAWVAGVASGTQPSDAGRWRWASLVHWIASSRGLLAAGAA